MTPLWLSTWSITDILLTSKGCNNFEKCLSTFFFHTSGLSQQNCTIDSTIYIMDPGIELCKDMNMVHTFFVFRENPE